VARKTWFITGASRGFGRIWAEAALERGDRVVATARNPAALDDLVAAHGDAVLALPLDVSDPDAVRVAVAAAVEHYGRLDVVVNNAGYAVFGPVEDVPPEVARRQFEVNLFGALWVTQAVLPHLREQGGGHILQVSSMAGLASWPWLGLYHASKWALEGLSESLAQEVAPFGIRVTLIEPAAYRTDWRGSSAVWVDPGPAYHGPVSRMRSSSSSGMVPGDPRATAAAVLAVVDAEAPPLRILLGGEVFETVSRAYETRLETWKSWWPVTVAAQGDPGTAPAPS